MLANRGEQQYLDLVSSIMANGKRTKNRTGVDTIATFGNQLRFSLKDGSFPLLTTKKMAIGAIIGELLWFISGKTDGRILLDQGIKIWAGNGSREYLDSIGLEDRGEHDLGPIYGHSMRHYGAKYVDCKTEYEGIDQLQGCIDMIKRDPTSRRIIMNLWDPVQLAMMALPPCHLLYQFNCMLVEGQYELSLMMTMRSCDVALGLPFNIASCALLVRMMCEVCDMLPGDLIINMGNTHIYDGHIEGLKKQLGRQPYEFPKLSLPKRQKIEDYTAEDFTIEGYQYHAYIKMDMVV